MKLITTYSILILFLVISNLKSQDTILYEGFEEGDLPDGWLEIKVKGNFKGEIVNWDYQDGGHAAHPPSAATGNYNALFFYESYSNEATKLVTPSFSLLNKSKPVLRFNHAMETWNWGADYWDKLKVYYKRGVDSAWVILEEYLNPVEIWTSQELLIADSLFTDDFYIAFEGITGYGHGVCIDDVLIVETDTSARRIDEIKARQTLDQFIPSGTLDNVLMRIDFYVIGNNGDAILNSIELTSLNDDDNDIASGGVNLYWTSDSIFSTENQLGSGINFISGAANFSGLDYSLPTGYTAVWVTYDLEQTAVHGNTLDLMIEADAIDVNGGTYPESDISPSNSRLIEETIFIDDFEEDKEWVYSGEFQRNQPQGIGGNGPGNSDPSEAYSGDTIIGTDITGLNSYLGDYEPNLSAYEYQAISPTINCKYYKDIKLSFQRWLNVDLFDKAYIHVSGDNGDTWNSVWVNGSFYTDNEWKLIVNEDATSYIERQDSIKVRFSLGTSNGLNNYSGWNIDDFIVTGDYVANDVGVSGWITPTSGCGHTSSETVSVKVKNYGPTTSKDTIPLCYSFNGGSTFVYDTMYESIDPGQVKTFTFSTTYDLTTPGLYEDIIAKTLLECDEYESNNQFDTVLYFEPTYSLPYTENFESGTGFWFAGGDALWEYGDPNGSVIVNAYSGTNAWVTDLDNYYGSYDSAYFESPCFNFYDSRYPVIDFMTNYITENDSDGMVILYSIDGGNSWDYFDTLDYKWDWEWYSEDTVISLDYPGFEDNSDGWIHVKQFIPEILRGETSVKFRFLFKSYLNSSYYEGVAIDDIQFFESPPDVGVTELVAPDSACEFNEKQLIKVAVKNYAFDTLFIGTEIPLGFDLNGSFFTIDTLTLSKILIPNDTVHFTFSDSVEMPNTGRYYYDIYTLMDDDTDYYIDSINNDTLNTFISVYGMPEYDLGPTIGMEIIDTLLDAGAGYTSYNWEDGDSLTRYYRATTEGMYNVTVINEHGCVKSDSLRVLQSVEDLGVTALISPQSDCEFANDTVIKVTIQNFKTAVYGTDDTIVVGYILDNNPIVIDSIFLASPLGALGSFDYEFVNPVDLSEFRDYDFLFFTMLEGDLDYTNDTLKTTISAWGYPDVEIGPDTIFTSLADTITFDAGSGFATYLWQDGSTNQTFTPSNRRSKEYKVTVTDVHSCGVDMDSVQIIAYDLAVQSIISPVNSCELFSNETVTIRVRNMGQDTIFSSSQIPVSYKVDSDPTVNEDITLAADLLPSAYTDYSFSSLVDMSVVSDYDYTFYCAYPNDIDQDNDTVKSVISNWGYPVVDLGDDTIYTSQADTVLLIADSGYASYSWNVGGTDDTLFVPDNSSKWYTVTVTSQYGCITKDSTYMYTFDIGITNISSPTSACELTSSEEVRVSITNFGETAIQAGTIIPVSYVLNGSTTISEDYSLVTTLNSGNSITYTFLATLDMSSIGSYFLEAFTEFPNDVVTSNDDYDKQVQVFGYPDINIGPDTLFTKQPDTVVLIADPGYTSYLWNTGSTNDSLSLTNTNSTWYKVDVTSQYGCHSYDSIFIYAYDIGISDIIAPLSNCELSSNENITVTITNFSSDTFKTGENIDLAYRIDTQTPVVEIYNLTSDLLPSSNVNYTFTTQGAFDAVGEYQLRAYTLLYQDVESLNDETIDTVKVYGYPNINLGNDTTIRALEHILDAGGSYDSYLWQDNSTEQTFTVGISGTYYVTVSDIYGCDGSDTINIIMLMPDFSVSSLINPVTQCYENGTVNPVVRMLNTGTDTIKTGENVNIGYYLNDIFIDEQSFTVNTDIIPDDSADYTFSNSINVLQYENHNFKVYSDFARDLYPSNDTVLLVKTIYPYPEVFIGNDTTIQSKTLELDAGYNENYSYLWQDASTEQTYLVNYDGSLSKIYEVTVTDTRLNCSSEDDIVITFRIRDIELTDVMLPSPICQFEIFDAQITVHNEGNTNILSSDTLFFGYINEDEEKSEYNVSMEDLLANQSALVSVENISFKHSDAQNVRLYIRTRNDVDHVNDTLIRNVNTFPAPDSKMGGESDTLKSPLPVVLTPLQDQTSYLWNDASTSSTYTATSEKWYWVDITGTNGCVYRDSVYVLEHTSIFTVSDLGEKIIVYPIPAKERLYIITQEKLTSDYNFVIFNNNGKLIESGILDKDKIINYEVNIENIPSGIYFMKIFNNDYSYTKKLIFNTEK